MKPVNYKIVPLRERHLQDLSEIDAASHAPWSKEGFKSELTNAVATYFVAETEDKKAIGYIGYWWSFTEVQITFLAVHPNCRRQGIAERLVRYAADKCRKIDVQTMQLEVRRGNGAAIALYEKLGFVKVGVRPKYYGGVEDAILMDLSL